MSKAPSLPLFFENMKYKGIKKTFSKRGLTVKKVFRVICPFHSILLILEINHPPHDDTLRKLTPTDKFFEVVVVCAHRIMWLVKEKINNQQKQPFSGVLKKRYPGNMQQIYRRTPMPKCDFIKVAEKPYWNGTLTWMFSCKFVAYFQSIFH